MLTSATVQLQSVDQVASSFPCTNNHIDYGQYTTLWDRLGGSYRQPNEELFRRETKMGQKEWERQVQEMEKLVKEVEGDDERSYEGQAIAKKVM
jgi:hypothetical protein